MLKILCFSFWIFPVVSAAKTLVIIDDETHKESYKSIFNFLQKRGHHLDFYMATDKGLRLSSYGEYIYDNILLASPSVAQFPKSGQDSSAVGYLEMDRDRASLERRKRAEKTDKGLSMYDFTDFVDSGRNLMIMTGEEVRGEMRKLCLEFGMDVDEPASKIYDHIAYDEGKDAGDHSLIRVPARHIQSSVVGGELGEQEHLLVRGMGHRVNEKNDLVFSVLQGTKTSYTAVSSRIGGKNRGAPISSGSSEISVVSALQARNDARVLLISAMEMCGDLFFGINDANRKFCESLLTWTFQERAVLKMSPFRHHKAGESVNPYMYREKDFIHFQVDITEKLSDGSWAPYRANDVQLELVMLDPYLRKFLTPVQGSEAGTFTAEFQAPDVYGIFKMKILYKRKGYNVLHQEEVTPLRNFKHNDYERFIWCATPYYASCAVTVVTLVLFSITFMFHRAVPAVSASKKKN